MSLPDYQSFMTPLLQCLADGKTVKLKGIEANVYQSLRLSADQLKLRIPSGKQTYAYLIITPTFGRRFNKFKPIKMSYPIYLFLTRRLLLVMA